MTSRDGCCVWLTGLSGAGKSTTSRTLIELLEGLGPPVVLLDGDDIRARGSGDLGFSRADRDANVLRVAARAHDEVAAGRIVVAAMVSPYRRARLRARTLVGHARFVEVFVDAPLKVCEARDVKGLYARARRGEISGFTGIDDPYEAPLSPDLVVDSAAGSADCNARRILRLLMDCGLV